jgi:hypothetical protein
MHAAYAKGTLIPDAFHACDGSSQCFDQEGGPVVAFLTTLGQRDPL